MALVGIDSMNIDDTRGGERPVHSMLLGAEILIVEHLCNLAALPDEGFEFSAIPPKVQRRRHVPGARAGSVVVGASLLATGEVGREQARSYAAPR